MSKQGLHSKIQKQQLLLFRLLLTSLENSGKPVSQSGQASRFCPSAYCNISVTWLHVLKPRVSSRISWGCCEGERGCCVRVVAAATHFHLISDAHPSPSLVGRI